MTGLLLLVLGMLGQAPSPAPTAPATAAAGASDDYVVGPGDVLDIAVQDNADLTRAVTVQTDGGIVLPLVGEVRVAGLSVVEIQRKLTTLLERDFLVNPQVQVSVRDYQSQSVIVLGEVNNPGRKPLRGRTRLIDVLIDAGGFKPASSGEVVITRSEGAFTGGTDTLRLRFGGGAMSLQDRVNLEVLLRHGDLVNVLPKQQVTIEGEVARPGRHPIEADTTITAAISSAGGVTRFGSERVKIRRVDPDSGKTEILEVDLKAIRNGKKPDVLVRPNDVVSVPRRRF